MAYDPYNSYFRRVGGLRARSPYAPPEPEPPPIGRAVSPFSEQPFSQDFLRTSPPQRAVAPPPESAFDPAQIALAVMPALKGARAANEPVPRGVGSLAFLPPATVPPSGVPGGERATIPGMPQPAPEEIPPPRDPIEDARAEYQAGAPTTTKGRILQALANAGLGALQAAGRDRENPLGAALGGAAAGGLISAVNPRYGRAYQFEQFKRPEIEDRMRREREREDRAYSLRERDLKEQGARADIELKGAQRRKLLAPADRAVPLATRLGRNVRTGQLDYYNAADPAQAAEWEPAEFPKERGPHPITFEGKTYDYNDPVQRAALEKAQNAVPRDPRGRYISRSDERATAKGLGGGGAASRREEKDLQSRTSQAAAGVNAVEKLFREAMESPESKRPVIFNQMRSMAGNLQAQFGDLVEVGEHNGWPVVRLRRRDQPAARPASQRPASNDRLGIR